MNLALIVCHSIHPELFVNLHVEKHTSEVPITHTLETVLSTLCLPPAVKEERKGPFSKCYIHPSSAKNIVCQETDYIFAVNVHCGGKRDGSLGGAGGD